MSVQFVEQTHDERENKYKIAIIIKLEAKITIEQAGLLLSAVEKKFSQKILRCFSYGTLDPPRPAEVHPGESATIILPSNPLFPLLSNRVNPQKSHHELSAIDILSLASDYSDKYVDTCGYQHTDQIYLDLPLEHRIRYDKAMRTIEFMDHNLNLLKSGKVICAPQLSPTEVDVLKIILYKRICIKNPDIENFESKILDFVQNYKYPD